MNNIEKLMKLPGNTPYHVPLRVKVVAVSATTKYQRDGVEKIAVADGTGYKTAICYDSAKMSMLKLDNSVMLRNYIKKAYNTIVINRPTVVSLTSAVTVSDVTIAEAKRHIDALPEAVKIIDAVKVEGTTVTIIGIAKSCEKLTESKTPETHVIEDDALGNMIRNDKRKVVEDYQIKCLKQNTSN
ncbi:Hypothetical predicted protein [Mytilus galloprovincialis]|uniref:Uncharacterized protein n=1 Tax=Mytilus galloprovincialis TaxID=29158 RepID=A0A8B6EHR9_MYTGA|nr:Hypothetical predicted protein [Mytilus galloprovincialis]